MQTVFDGGLGRHLTLDLARPGSLISTYTYLHKDLPRFASAQEALKERINDMCCATTYSGTAVCSKNDNIIGIRNQEQKHLKVVHKKVSSLRTSDGLPRLKISSSVVSLFGCKVQSPAAQQSLGVDLFASQPTTVHQ